MSVPTIQTHLTPSYTSWEQNLSPKEVAEEFESLFLSQLLSIMQDSVESSGLLKGGPGKEVYMAMMNQEMGRALAAGGGVGISKLIEPYVSQGAVSLQPGAHVKEAYETKPLEGFTISSNMGWRRDPFTGEQCYHRGVDLAAPYGTQVRSLSRGRVLFAGQQGGYGTTVVIQSNNGVRTRYAHLSELGVKEGEEVSRGQEIGKVGDSGRATGPHLHLEMEHSGKLLNPLMAGIRL